MQKYSQCDEQRMKSPGWLVRRILRHPAQCSTFRFDGETHPAQHQVHFQLHKTNNWRFPSYREKSYIELIWRPAQLENSMEENFPFSPFDQRVRCSLKSLFSQEGFVLKCAKFQPISIIRAMPESKLFFSINVFPISYLNIFEYWTCSISQLQLLWNQIWFWSDNKLSFLGCN